MNVPDGIAASSELLSRALGQAFPSQRVASAADGCRQQVGSGQRYSWRRVVSRPRNHFTWANGVPTLTENAPASVLWMLDVHQ